MTNDLVKSLAAEADALRDENARLREVIASREETIRQQRVSIEYAKVTIENLKATQCQSWARDAKRVCDTLRNEFKEPTSAHV